jgi:gamma-glutamylcyclotransferase (GGCT)/AIG2-like uncharacterized protein YtfP
MAKDEVFQLFVYGSLRSGFRSPAYEYISKHFDYVGEGRVKGKLYDMGSYPAAKPMEDEHFIIGELYTARQPSEFDWAIGQLDDYEGTSGESDEATFYRRDLADVFIANKTVPAWIYWYTGDISGKPEIPSGDLIEYISRGK